MKDIPLGKLQTMLSAAMCLSPGLSDRVNGTIKKNQQEGQKRGTENLFSNIELMGRFCVSFYPLMTLGERQGFVQIPFLRVATKDAAKALVGINGVLKNWKNWIHTIHTKNHESKERYCSLQKAESLSVDTIALLTHIRKLG